MNKITWTFSREEKGDYIYRGETSKGAVFYGIKDGDEIKDITLYSAPKRKKVITEFENKLDKAKLFVNSLNRDSTFVMYEKPKEYFRKNTFDWNSMYDYDRVYGWTICAKLIALNEASNSLVFYSSLCSKKDKFCKNIAIYESFQNYPIYSITIPKQSFKDNHNLFIAICKSLLIPKIEKKAKIRI